MAGTLKTDLIAVDTALIDADRTAMPIGVNPDMLIQVAIDKVQDIKNIVVALNGYLPSGSAKTALAAVLTDLT